MIPAHYAPLTHSFMVDDRKQIRVLLVSEALTAQARTTPTEPLWFMEIHDRGTLEAVLRWLRVRRALWSSWGKLGETLGRGALAIHMDKLLKAEPPAQVVGFMFETVEEHDDELVLGELLATAGGLQKCVYHRHCFADAELRTSFQDWLLNNDPEGNGAALLEVALNSGAAKLSELINKIANEEHGRTQQAA